VVAGLGKILVAWWAGWRAHARAGAVDEALLEEAATAMAAVAAAAGVAPPATDVVAILGAPTGSGPHPMGDGGLAVTRFRAGRAATVVFAQAALTGLSSAALHSLAAHELAHVIGRRRASAAAPYAWLGGYLVLVAAGAGLTITAMLAAQHLAGPSLLATLVDAVAFLALRDAFERREEIAADLFAVDLTGDLGASDRASPVALVSAWP
jgi:Zn-dependent protease with chaperone function